MNILYIILKHVVWRFPIFNNYFHEIFTFCDFMNTLRNFAKFVLVQICKLENKSVHFVGFKSFAKIIMKVKRKITEKKGMLALHCQKWDAVREILLT